MKTLQRCSHCGFEIGDEGHSCRTDPHLSPEQLRAARQVAGLELPTRGVYELPHAGSRRERPPARPGRRPSWASDLVAFGTMLVLTALLAFGLQQVAEIDRYAMQLPDGTADVLGRVGVALLVVAAITVVLAVTAWACRSVSRWRHRDHRPPMVPLAG